VNADRILGGPLTLELTDLPEQQALDILLRAVSGYLAAPRPVPVANASVFDRIVVMPTSVAPTAPPSAQAAPSAQSGAQQPRPLFDDDQDDDRAFPPVPGQNRAPIFNVPPPPIAIGPRGPMPNPTLVGPPGQQVFPPSPIGPGGPPPASTYPGATTTPAPLGTAVPGMPMPTPAPQPGQPEPAESWGSGSRIVWSLDWLVGQSPPCHHR
jgi:hypothetical protein